MLDILLDIVGEGLVYAVFGIVLYWLGRISVTVVSLGRWRCEWFLTRTPKSETQCLGMFHYRGDKIYFTSNGTIFVGTLVFLFLTGVSAAIWYWKIR